MPEDGGVAPDSPARTSEVDFDASVPPLQFSGVGIAPEQLVELRHRLQRWARRTGLGEDQVDDLVLAAYEALTNATEHAYPSGTGEVSLIAARTVDDRVVVIVRDRGHWRPPPTDPGLRGRGLLLIRRLAHQVELRHDRHGTTVRMHWRLQPAGAEPG